MAANDDVLSFMNRELGAVAVRVEKTEDAAPIKAAAASPLEIRCAAPGGFVIATFAAPPQDAAASTARLALLVEGFRDALASEIARASTLADGGRASAPPESDTLHDALAALADRAGALDALVIDARSPIVWGSAGEMRGDEAQVIELTSSWRDAIGGEEALRIASRFGVSATFEVTPDASAVGCLPASICVPRRVVPLRADETTLELAMANPGDIDAIHDAALATGKWIIPTAAPAAAVTVFAAQTPRFELPSPDDARRAHAAAVREDWQRHFVLRRAIPAIRALPEVASLARGGHLNHVHKGPDLGYAAHSFAQIYVLVVVFDRPFDEFAVRRATIQALPQIERLVLALPPRDPSSGGGQAAAMGLVRGGRRRR